MSLDMLSSKQKVFAIAGIVVVVLIIGYCYIRSTSNVYGFDEVEENFIEDEDTETDEEETDNETMIVVHITGAVVNEGIVSVNANSRINDVIEAAGGTTEDADLKNVNLAYTVEDGQKIHIPSKGEEPADEQNTVTDANGVVTDTAGANLASQTSSGRININTADEGTLDSLPGIGSATAQKIIAYRNTNRKIQVD